MSLIELTDRNIDQGKVWYASNYAHVWEYKDKCNFAHGWSDWREWLEDLSGTWNLGYRPNTEIFR